MAVIAALNALLLLYVPWSSNWVPSLVVAGICTIGLYAILWILALIAKLMEGRG